jgi:hypothetical protein
LKLSYGYKFDIRKLKINPDDIECFEYLYKEFYNFSTLELIVLAHEYNKTKQNVKDYVDFEVFLCNVEIGMNVKDAIKPEPCDYGIDDFYDDTKAMQYDVFDNFEDDYSDDDMNKYDNYDEDNPYYSESDEDIKADRWYGFHED